MNVQLIWFLIGLCQIIFGNEILVRDEYSKQRSDMVKYQIQQRGIRDTTVLKAMLRVPRHRFVSEKYHHQAYADHPLPIGYGQTVSQPYIVALMTELVELKKGKKVLEIGTGSGYQAAVCAEITDSVFTIEIIKELAESAVERLEKLGYTKVKVKNADGYYGWKEYAPFDAIIVTAAAEHIPPPLIEQLSENGKIVIPVGHPYQVQNLMLVEKKNGKVSTKNIIPVRFVPLTRGR